MAVSSNVTAALILAGAGAASGVGSSIAAGKMNKLQLQLEREKLAAQQAAQLQQTALTESGMDPFRQQLDQAGAIGKLDRIERATYAPTHLTAPARYAGSVPQMSGGFSYDKSPELVSSAAALKRNVMGGNTAPTMTNPANYGRTATLDLLRIASDGVDPGTVNATGARGVTPGTAPMDYMADTTRRGGGTGGVVGGAVKGASVGSMAGPWGTAAGAVGGALVGAATKHAKTAPTDVDVQTATTVLTRAIQGELGRAPLPGEIEKMLAGQGLQPGDRYVGSGGMNAIIATLRDQGASMRPSYSGAA